MNGKTLAKELRHQLKREISKLSGRKPGLAFILIGEDPPSKTYVKMKKKGCEEVGILSTILELSETISQEDLLKKITQLNQDPTIDGILVQQPFPSHIKTGPVVEAIDPKKDVDGFHPYNLGRILLGEEGGFAPCTPLGIQLLLENDNVELSGKEVVIVGRSNIVGKPLAALLMQKGVDATITVAHSKTQNLRQVTQKGDILIAAIGQPHFITKEMVKPGAIVIDVGINRTNNGLVGDVDYENVKTIASAITPVPGGVGPMTIASLLMNTYKSYKCHT